MSGYRLPEALGGGECTVVEEIGYCALAGEPAVVVQAGDGTYVMVRRGDLTTVEPPLPPEPPVDSVYFDTEERVAWQRCSHDWAAREGRYLDWAELSRRPIVRLVPDPAAGVELPWHAPEAEMNAGARNLVDLNGDGEVSDRVQLVLGGWHNTNFTPAGARAKAAALLAAADAAEVQP